MEKNSSDSLSQTLRHIKGELEKIKLQIDALNQARISNMERFRQFEEEIGKLRIEIMKKSSSIQETKGAPSSPINTDLIYDRIVKLESDIEMLKEGLKKKSVPKLNEEDIKKIAKDVSSMLTEDLPGKIKDLENTVESLKDEQMTIENSLSEKVEKLSREVEEFKKGVERKLNTEIPKIHEAEQKLRKLEGDVGFLKSEINRLNVQSRPLTAVSELTAKVIENESEIKKVEEKVSKIESAVQKLSDYFVDTIKQLTNQINEIRSGGRQIFSRLKEFEPPRPPTKAIFTKLVPKREEYVKEAKQPEMEKKEYFEPAEQTHDVDVLKEQVKEYLEMGYSKDRIIQHLIMAGYDRTLIEKVLKEMTGTE